jgi:hypothetical protein
MSLQEVTIMHQGTSTVANALSRTATSPSPNLGCRIPFDSRAGHGIRTRDPELGKGTHTAQGSVTVQQTDSATGEQDPQGSAVSRPPCRLADLIARPWFPAVVALGPGLMGGAAVLPVGALDDLAPQRA